MFNIEYWGKLPSVNHMYGRNPYGTTYLKPQGKLIKQAIAFKNRAKMPQDKEIGYQLTIYADWYNKSKKAQTRIKRRDSNNLIKLIIDGCCEALGVDDSQIFEEYVEKVQSDKEGFEIEFFLLNPKST